MTPERAALVRAVEDEPELPDEMPEPMWESIRNDREAATELCRLVVRATKKNIRERVLAAYDAAHPEEAK